MTVSGLIALLQQEDPNAEVGISMSRRSGYVQKFAGIVRSETGVVCLDQAEETIGEEEIL